MPAIDLIHAAHDADNAWQAEIVRIYGKRAAPDARYDERGTRTAELQRLYLAKLQGSLAIEAVFRVEAGAPVAEPHSMHVACYRASWRPACMTAMRKVAA